MNELFIKRAHHDGLIIFHYNFSAIDILLHRSALLSQTL